MYLYSTLNLVYVVGCIGIYLAVVVKSNLQASLLALLVSTALFTSTVPLLLAQRRTLREHRA